MSDIREEREKGEEVPAYEIDYSKILMTQAGSGDEGQSVSPPVSILPIHAQISLLEAYLYLGRAEVRGL
jgi:hypothetical protein